MSKENYDNGNPTEDLKNLTEAFKNIVSIDIRGDHTWRSCRIKRIGDLVDASITWLEYKGEMAKEVQEFSDYLKRKG